MKQLLYPAISNNTAHIQWVEIKKKWLKAIANTSIPTLFPFLNFRFREKKSSKEITKNYAEVLVNTPAKTWQQEVTTDPLEQRSVLEKICMEKKLEETLALLRNAVSLQANEFKISGKVQHIVSANKKALGVVLKNLLFYINEQNKNETISLNIFEDESFTTLVAEHRGPQASPIELKQTYQTKTSAIVDSRSNLLYSLRHIMFAIGGFLTTGKRPDGENYVALGFPK
jgi:hypothetical protein